MNAEPQIQPLPIRHRKRTFWLLLLLFVCALPFLFLYATGYRFEFGGEANIISTGGMYIAAERTGAEIYIDGELVRETRAFRRAFYAQSLTPGTHRVHVQKEDHHTWVKELPVTAHLVTEAQAFNLPLVPQVRVISEWQSASGSAIVGTPLLLASTTNSIVATTTTATSTFTKNSEYVTLMKLFATTTATSSASIRDRVISEIDSILVSTTTEEVATTTIETSNVRLYEDADELYAAWIGSREEMPYYYCAEDFPPYSTSTEPVSITEGAADELAANTAEFIHPVQTVPEDAVCEPVVRMDRHGEKVHAFDFLPGSTDFVIIALSSGVYVVEVDDRSWQNAQPLMLGEELDVRVENGQIYIYDGVIMYQINIEY